MSLPQAGPSVLVAGSFLLPAEVVAFASASKGALCGRLGTLPGHFLNDQSRTRYVDVKRDLHTVNVRRVDVLVPIHLFSAIVVRLGFVSVVASVGVVRVVLLTTRRWYPRTSL